MIEHKPDDRVSIGTKLDHMITEQAAFGTNAKLKEEGEKDKTKTARLIMLSVGALVLFLIVCLSVIFISKSGLWQ